MPPIDEERIAALIDALQLNPRITGADLGPLIRQELARTPTRDRPALLGYFEQWCTRQFEILLPPRSGPDPPSRRLGNPTPGAATYRESLRGRWVTCRLS